MRVEKNYYFSDTVNKLNVEIIDSGFVYADTEWKEKNVCSPFSRLYFIESGEGIIKFGGEKLVLRPGNVYLIPAGLKFSNYCEGEMKKLFFHLNVFKPDGYDLFVNSGKCFQKRISPDKIKILSELYRSSLIENTLLLKHEILGVLAEFVPELSLEQISITTYSKMVQKAIDYIQLNLSNGITMCKLSEKLYVSENTLRKKFKDEVGITIGKYIDDLLFFTAEKLLQKSDWSIAQISDSLGFCDQFYFSKKFKERFGTSPLRYRKNRKSVS